LDKKYKDFDSRMSALETGGGGGGITAAEAEAIAIRVTGDTLGALNEYLRESALNNNNANGNTN